MAEQTFAITCPKCKELTQSTEVVPLAHYRCQKCSMVVNVTNIRIGEWLGFNYSQYLKSIIGVIHKDDFSNLKANNAADIARGKLSAPQVNKLKKVFVNNFQNGGTIRDISKDIRADVKIKDLKVYNANGDLVQVIPKEARSVNIARTETTRLANMGARDNYKDGGIRQIAWIAAMSDRTCETCTGLNGKIFDINTSELPPAHALCRCTTQAVIPKRSEG